MDDQTIRTEPCSLTEDDLDTAQGGSVIVDFKIPGSPARAPATLFTKPIYVDSDGRLTF
ncbi:MAG: hypothetical protein AAGD13_15235 [Pseudomonadota bacterium]